MRIIVCFILLFIISGCDEFVPDKGSTEMNLADFEFAWEHINRNYPLFEFKDLNWDDVYDKYRNQAEQTMGDDIYQVLYDMVGELEDGHASIVTFGGEKLRPFTPFRRVRDGGKVNATLLRKYFNSPLSVIAGEGIEFGYVRDKIGYIRISTFGKRLKGRQHEFGEVIRHMSNADGLIIDVRENNGGSSTIYDPIVSYLIHEPIETGPQWTVSEVIAPAVIDPFDGPRFMGEIAVLINGTTFSAGEVFADRFWNLDHVTLIGDTTAGGGLSSNIDPLVPLPSGKAISINYSAVLKRNGEILEWNGVAPDIHVPHSRTDVKNGIDTQLEFAIEYLLED